MKRNLPSVNYEKFVWIFIILLLIEFAAIWILTPTITRSNTYEPNEIDINGNTYVKLICESNTLFITSNSDITCKVSIRSKTWDYENIGVIIQAKDESGKVVYGCSAKIDDLKNKTTSNLTLCENDWFNSTISRPSDQYNMELIEFRAYFPQWNKEMEPVRNKEFDRPLEVVPRIEELSIVISNNNLFIATVSLLVMAVFELRKFLNEARKNKHTSRRNKNNL